MFEVLIIAIHCLLFALCLFKLNEKYQNNLKMHQIIKYYINKKAKNELRSSGDFLRPNASSVEVDNSFLEFLASILV